MMKFFFDCLPVPLKKFHIKVLIILVCCVIFIFCRFNIFSTQASLKEKVYPTKDHYEQSFGPSKSPKQRWVEQVRHEIEKKGFKELLPLMERLKRKYSDEDEELYDIISAKYLIRPPREDNGAYWHLKNNGEETSMGQAQAVMEIFKNMTNGTFLECGALDGEMRSNTLTLEKNLGWRGVLIEADPENLMQLIQKRRRAWVVPACLSTQRSTMEVSFRAWGNIGSIVDNKTLPEDNLEKQNMTKVVEVVCLPFYAILKSLKIWQIDYLSLDVEGNELDILKTIPFDKINIKVISAEFFHSSEKGDSKETLRNFMESMGYGVHSEVTHPDNLANDFIFVKKGVGLLPEDQI